MFCVGSRDTDLSEDQRWLNSNIFRLHPNNSMSVLEPNQSVAITSPRRQSEGKGVYYFFGCHTNVPQTGDLNTFVSQFWRLAVQNEGLSRTGSF